MRAYSNGCAERILWAEVFREVSGWRDFVALRGLRALLERVFVYDHAPETVRDRTLVCLIVYSVDDWFVVSVLWRFAPRPTSQRCLLGPDSAVCVFSEDR